MEDVFVHDRRDGTTTRVSVSSNGDQSEAPSLQPAISGNGRYVAFTSWASNLVPDDTNGHPDVFVHDTVTKSEPRSRNTGMRSRSSWPGRTCKGV